MNELPELIVVSDLHIGRGLNPATRRYHNLEAFFYDDDLADFCHWLCQDAEARRVKIRLVLNGDIFDFLRIDRGVGARPSGIGERLFGSALTPRTAADIVKSQLAGHPQFASSLAWMLARGHEIIFLPGNHDLEVHWQSVQGEVRAAIDRALDDVPELPDREEALARLLFKPWFHYEEGRVWIEHGCQYDPENAFRYPLRGKLADDEGYSYDEEADLPLGNFFQRYLYNAFGSITFIVPTSRANARYFKWLVFNQPRLLLRVATRHLPFAVQLLRRMARFDWSKTRDLEHAHRQQLDDLALESGLGQKLRDIDELKSDKAHASQAAEAIVREGLRLVLVSGAVVITVAALWFSVGHAIDGLKLGFGWKTLLSVLSNAVLAVAALAGLAWGLIRISLSEEPIKPLRRAAERIAAMLDVPIVSFGHTHDEGVWPLPRVSGEPSWYFNTGTWIAVFTHDVFLPRDRVQFTYLHVQGHEGELRQWSPGRGHPAPVVLIDERRPFDPPLLEVDADGGAAIRGGPT